MSYSDYQYEYLEHEQKQEGMYQHAQSFFLYHNLLLTIQQVSLSANLLHDLDHAFIPLHVNITFELRIFACCERVVRSRLWDFKLWSVWALIDTSVCSTVIKRCRCEIRHDKWRSEGERVVSSRMFSQYFSALLIYFYYVDKASRDPHVWQSSNYIISSHANPNRHHPLR